jgi:DNA replication protein DnaC
VATQAAADNADHLSYLLRLTELELLEREKRSAERRIKFARFPTLKTLETFDFASRPSVNKVLIAELMRCEYIDKKENILMVGNPGTGKSHLATALAAEACAKGYRVRFIRTTELVTALIEARDERSFLRLKGQFAKLDLLVLDELGYVPASKVGSELLFDVISTCRCRERHPRSVTCTLTRVPAPANIGKCRSRSSTRRSAVSSSWSGSWAAVTKTSPSRSSCCATR